MVHGDKEPCKCVRTIGKQHGARDRPTVDVNPAERLANGIGLQRGSTGCI